MSEVRSGSILNKKIITTLLGNIYDSGQAKPDKKKGTNHMQAANNKLHRFNQYRPNNQNCDCP